MTRPEVTLPPYDSRVDTWAHIDIVRKNLGRMIADLQRRADAHDKSKLVDPEKSVFDEYTPKLKDSTYGSPEYASFLEGMGEGLRHHYRYNDHHPEHHANGIRDMNLLQVMEMLCDWGAAVQRHDDGDLRRSVEINAERFGYGDELKRLLLNTIDEVELSR